MFAFMINLIEKPRNETSATVATIDEFSFTENKKFIEFDFNEK